ncbi:MAG: hypothetical protein ACLP0J_14585 [Solirubrobacteraceae bacterium]
MRFSDTVDDVTIQPNGRSEDWMQCQAWRSKALSGDAALQRPKWAAAAPCIGDISGSSVTWGAGDESHA